ncbi:MAG TPA: NAD(P)-dependent oxidoreductase [Bacteroidia bacterium]|nr:NAD(P)-dependent oxidoreductase [Bacteroidia bacterium]
MSSILTGHPNILITGSSGFIGGFLVEEALARGMNVFAAIRASSNKQYLKNSQINFVELDLSSVPNLSYTLTEIVKKFGKIDYIIHNAGLTKASKKQHYFDVNTDFTGNFLNALLKANILPLKFIFMSSLAAYGPGNSTTFEPIKNDDIPAPISTYGESKLKAEQLIKSQHEIPWIIIRPTAVFGPREKEIFAIFQLINRNIHPWVNNKNQRLTFIYVRDLARVVLDSTLSNHFRKAYFVSDGQEYQSKAFGESVKKCIGKKTLNIPISENFLKFIAHKLEVIYNISGKTPGLNMEKALELGTTNWKCDIIPLVSDIGFKPAYTLESGIKETVVWYKNEGWL